MTADARDLAAKQRLYGLAFEDADEATLVFAADGRVLLVNGAARALADPVLRELAVEGDALRRLRAATLECGRARVVVALATCTVLLEGRTHGRQHVVTLQRIDDAPGRSAVAPMASPARAPEAAAGER